MRFLTIILCIAACGPPIVEEDDDYPAPDAQLACTTPITILAPRPELHYATDLAVIAQLPWENVTIFAIDDTGASVDPLGVPDAQRGDPLTLTWQFALQPSHRYTVTINGPEETGCSAAVEFFTSP
jgi:hypothetical protein